MKCMLTLLKAIDKALDRELKKYGVKVPHLTRAQEAEIKKKLWFRR